MSFSYRMRELCGLVLSKNKNRLKVGVWLTICLHLSASISAQTLPSAVDTLQGYDSATVSALPFMQKMRSLSAAAIARRWPNPFDRGQQGSLVNAMNTIAGVRMEERSPGSYRLNIRGSSLRSPFGVRNVKVYWNQLPLTDAGGNTYFNQLAINAPQIISIYKGPAGSLYGAGTGGAVLVQGLDAVAKNQWQAGYSMGSFGVLNVSADMTFGDSLQRHHISYMHNETGGYRDQSAMRRDNVGVTTKFYSGKKSSLSGTALATRLVYQTPGGLTPAQFQANPKSARPAAGSLPSAVAAKAAIYQTNLMAGLYHQYQINKHWHTETGLSTAVAYIQNPSIRNYETRNEPNAGVRSMIVYQTNKENTAWQWHTGVEYQYGRYNVQVAENVNGQRGATQTNDDLTFNTGFLFTQLQLNTEQWQLVAGASINKNNIAIARNAALPVTIQRRSFENAFAPRIELQYQWSQGWTSQISVSKGFSPPTAAEVLPSTGNIDLNLEAEQGYNYELANTVWLVSNRLQWNSNLFYFNLRNALVQQRDAAGADFFVNAGRTHQWGMEQNIRYSKFWGPQRFVSFAQAQLGYTWSAFKYAEYNKLGEDFSGKSLPGIPKHSIALSGDIETKVGVAASITYLYNSRTWLNDANSFYANAFHLLGIRMSYKRWFGKNLYWQLFAGVDNLLNEQYGLGHDINAFGNRFYNAAPVRNYYAGIALGK